MVADFKPEIGSSDVNPFPKKFAERSAILLAKLEPDKSALQLSKLEPEKAIEIKRIMNENASSIRENSKQEEQVINESVHTISEEPLKIENPTDDLKPKIEKLKPLIVDIGHGVSSTSPENRKTGERMVADFKPEIKFNNDNIDPQPV